MPGTRLLELAFDDPYLKPVVLTTEEEGVAFACGNWLGGKKSVLLMQSSGVGNAVNMLSLVSNCKFPFVTLVTMRGVFGEFNSWQVPMGKATPAVLAAIGIQVHVVEKHEQLLKTVDAALYSAFSSDQGIAVLLSQNLVKKKGVVMLKRREVIAKLNDLREGARIISGLGSPTYDLHSTGDNSHNFYLWGAMGGAAMVGLGVAMAQPTSNIIVVTGDGEMLMGIGSLATIGVQKPANLTLFVLDNGHFETGMQASHTNTGVNLARIAKASGFNLAETIETDHELRGFFEAS